MFDGPNAHPALAPEPLVRTQDLAEYRVGLAKRLSGEVAEADFVSFRTRYGVYGQKPDGMQMVRIKVPGGLIDAARLRVVAGLTRDFCQGDVHITTRQDLQVYFIPLARTADFLERLYAGGLTSREAGGSTLRNNTACALSGQCPREFVDAGKVAEAMARAWIRHPLVQHMPRKVKMSVSGCGTDCGASRIHDLGLVAKADGFEVWIGGGLGALPMGAVKVLDTIPQAQVPAAIEAMVRIHQRYSDRVNRNASRVKFLVKRFGAEKFTALYQEEFERVKALPQRPWEELPWDATPAEAWVDRTPMGVVNQKDGRRSVVVDVPLGMLTPDQCDGLADLAERVGSDGFRLTRDQNLAITGIAPERVDEAVAAVRALKLGVPDNAREVPDVVSCPGTSTCRIGITSSREFAKLALAQSQGDRNANGVTVRVSGCQNGCGLHRVGDFGFHGMAKKVNGQPAPHYQIHLGGDPRTGEVGLMGPIVSAKLADRALKLLRDAYAGQKAEGETVRAWAERLGKDGLAGVLKPLEGVEPPEVFLDWGDSEPFSPPPAKGGDCAAVFASDDLLADLADDGLILTDRALFAGNLVLALEAAQVATVQSVRRVLHSRFQFTKDEDTAQALVERLAALDAGLGAQVAALQDLRAQATSIEAAQPYREALAVFVDTVRNLLAPVQPEAEAAE